MGYRGVFEEDFMIKAHQENKILISVFRFQIFITFAADFDKFKTSANKNRMPMN